MDRLSKDFYVEIKPNIATRLGNEKIFQENREHIRIAQDRKFNISIIKIKEPLKIIKNGDKYFFSLK